MAADLRQPSIARPGHAAAAGMALLWFVLFAGPLWSQVPEIPRSTVGMPVQISDLVLPGPELEPVPITDETPVVVRIDAVYAHGTGFRYDLVCYTLEPGEFDVSDYLRRKDGPPHLRFPSHKCSARLESSKRSHR